MFSGLTRKEQQVLIFLIIIITVGLGIDYYQKQKKRKAIWIEAGQEISELSPEKPTDKEKPALSPAIGMKEGKIDINSATVDELLSLHGIGPVRAKAIIEYRDSVGGFKSVEEIINVKGIGPATFEKIKDQISVAKPQLPGTREQIEPELTEVAPIAPGLTPAPYMPVSPTPPKKININTATVEELKTLYRIGDVLAGRIIDYRTRHGPFQRPEDIMNVEGIGPKIFAKNQHLITVH